MAQICINDSHSSELEYEDDSHTSPSEILNPYDEDSPSEEITDFNTEKTIEDFNEKIEEFASLVDRKVTFNEKLNQIHYYEQEKKIEEVKKSWMDTIIDNKNYIFTAINVLSLCYGMYKITSINKQHTELTKQISANLDRTKEFELKFHVVEEVTKHLYQEEQKIKWLRKGTKNKFNHHA
jgi:hypothetical protein